MKEIDPVVAAIADSLWQQQRISRATGEAFPAPPPGAGDPLVQAMMLNQGRRDFSPTAPSAPFGYAPPVPQPPGMMLGPEWLGLNFPLAEAISPAGAHMVQGLLGGSGTGDDGLAQFLPGAGDAIDAWSALRYAGNAVHSGLLGDWNDMGQNASWAAVAAMGALPGLDAPSTQGIRAYHGSPYDFDQFDLSKIGTGEGAQAYGHGLYFAENPEVADLYSRVVTAGQQGWQGTVPPAFKAIPEEQLAKIPDEIRGRITAAWQNNGEEVAKNLTKKFFEESRGRPYSDALHAIAYSSDWKAPGHRYEVNIKANPEDFLDWDKPLSEQSEKVRAALAGLPGVTASGDIDNLAERYQAAYDAYLARPENASPELTAELEQAVSDAYGAWTDARGVSGSGATVYNTLAKGRAYSDAAEILKGAGIPGLRYLDQGSRAAAEGTRNYVVFDDKLIDIVRKYGIAGLLALPALGMFGGGDAEASQ